MATPEENKTTKKEDVKEKAPKDKPAAKVEEKKTEAPKEKKSEDFKKTAPTTTKEQVAVRSGDAKAALEDVWKPKTDIGRKVMSGEITDIDEVLNSGLPILESEIVEVLVPELETDLLMIGQAKGKFGGGQRRVFRQTQKKTREGNKPKFSTCVIAGNKNGHVGVGHGKSKETVPAREKAIRNSKLSMIRVKRGCGSWACNCGEAHSIPFKITGKCGSAEITLMPAPKGTGLCVEKECAKMLAFAGVKDIWSKTKGKTKTKINLIKACFKALQKLSETRVQPNVVEPLGIVDGRRNTKV